MTHDALGLAQGEVRLVPHNPQWAALFEEERAVLGSTLGAACLGIEHVGSTSIPGIDAKPILDICVAIGRFEEGFALVEPLSRVGYVFKGEYGVSGRHFFTRGVPTTHHLHIVELTSSFWIDHLLFRDYLRESESARKEYQSLKRDLAAAHAGNRDAYTDNKSSFVSSILLRARKKQA